VAYWTKILIKMRNLVLLLVFPVLFSVASGCTSEGVRSFYCLPNNKCVTIWKTESKKALIILGKYEDSKRPSDNYVELFDITNMVDWYADVIFVSGDSLIVDVGNNGKVICHSSQRNVRLFSDNKTLNDSLFTYFDGKYRKYKNHIEYLSINIKENYATDKTGKKLK